MNKLLALMQREYLQHRFGWSLMALIPLVLAALLLSFGTIQGLSVDGDTAFDAHTVAAAGPLLPAMLTVATIAGSAVVLYFIALISSLIIVSGIARRDHADRSIEFWMSLPVSHSSSLAAPLIVHLLLVPVAALGVGLLGGVLLSMVLVGRVVGIGAWFALPWGDVLPALLAIIARLLAGLPLTLLWASPLIMLVVLMAAWFRRWGWVIVGVVPAIAIPLLDRVFGQPVFARVLSDLLKNAGQALVTTGQGFAVGPSDSGLDALRRFPAVALHDYGLALTSLASPLLLGALLFAGGCFALLVQWRQRGAGVAGG